MNREKSCRKHPLKPWTISFSKVIYRVTLVKKKKRSMSNNLCSVTYNSEEIEKKSSVLAVIS
jgi:predicted CopG family antitoxin